MQLPKERLSDRSPIIGKHDLSLLEPRKLFHLAPWKGTLTIDAAGNLYGTTVAVGAFGQGSVFKLTRNNGNWIFADLYDFTGGADGANPFGNVTLDQSGNMYGTTSAGGIQSSNRYSGYYPGCGVVWKIAP